MPKDYNPSSTPYQPNIGGEIASPATERVVKSLDRSKNDAVPIRHNAHIDVGGGSTQIKGSAGEPITGDKIKGKGFSSDNL